MNSGTLGLRTVRQKQAYAGLCLMAFCRHFDVLHPALIDLIKHLFSMLNAADLSEWEEQGTQLELAGFGDPLPKELKMLFPLAIRDSAEELVNCASTIGVVDMYGALTNRPEEYLQDVVRILTGKGVAIPDSRPFESLPSDSGWGGKTNSSAYRKLIEAYDDLLSGVVDLLPKEN